MELNWLGPASAAATFLGVWIGHVSVRRIERGVELIWIPAMLALLLGIGLLTASFLTSNLIPSAICGILAVTLLWDALELAVRQPNRVKRGHAPANPHNPRHARILATYPEATTIDPLERDPRGSPYSNDEIASFKDASS
ncbi:MAG: hypothetical protein C3F07_18495 [Anaerolineales bacterium]|nr:MAG: hypothetical protein C3F07_18495 [Anaerolineales bacterium]